MQRLDPVSFPLQGARTGTFMLSLLEEINFSITNPDILSQQVEGVLSRYGFESGWQTVIEQMIWYSAQYQSVA